MPRDRGQAERSSGAARISSRRERDQRARRNERFAIIAVSVVLGVAALLVLVGLYVTQYRPPRAHVLSAAETDYQAAEVARRTAYELRFGELSGGIGEAVPETLTVLEEQSIVLARATRPRWRGDRRRRHAVAARPPRLRPARRPRGGDRGRWRLGRSGGRPGGRCGRFGRG